MRQELIVLSLAFGYGALTASSANSTDDRFLDLALWSEV